MRALNGECCIFPFKYNAKVYNDCTTDGSDQPWCAVRLPFFGAKMDWRQNCAGKALIFNLRMLRRLLWSLAITSALY